MHCLEIFSGVGACIHGDRRVATWMRALRNVRVGVVHLALDQDPRVICGVVRLDLLQGEELRAGGRGNVPRDFDRREGERRGHRAGWRSSTRDKGLDVRRILCGNHGGGLTCAERIPSVNAEIPPSGYRSHPATSLGGWFRGVLEPNIPLSIVQQVHLDPKVRVISHAHEVPSRVPGLAVVGLVPRAARDFRRGSKFAHIHVVRPQGPAPLLAIQCGGARELVIGQSPAMSSIERYLDPGYGAAATAVCVSFDRIRIVPARSDEGKRFAVRRGGNRRVDVELVKNVFGFLPPAFELGDLGSDVRR
mmetsp:Transcript_33096/g.83441  ORF Transcript_33096/g.83441 Transcript_33096/m.83441 type:complete len:305 (+) Transcript_33096:1329-2243(+)